jgi:hypothetical protein
VAEPPELLPGGGGGGPSPWAMPEPSTEMLDTVITDASTVSVARLHTLDVLDVLVVPVLVVLDVWCRMTASSGRVDVSGTS